MNDSSIARVVGVLFSPARIFEAIRERPTWLLALLAVVIISVVGSYLVTSKLDVEEVVRDSIADSGRQLSEEQIEQAIDIQEKLMPIFGIAGPLLFYPAACLLMALIIWVVLKMLGGDFPYKTSFATTVHGMIPNGVGGLLTIPVAMSRGELGYEEVKTGSILASNLGHFASEGTSKAVAAVMNSIDVFSIWSLVLLTIGYAVVARVSRGKAAAVVVGLWVVYILIKVGMAAAFA